MIMTTTPPTQLSKEKEKVKIQKNEPHKKKGGELMCSRTVAVPAPRVTSVVLLLNNTNVS